MTAPVIANPTVAIGIVLIDPATGLPYTASSGSTGGSEVTAVLAAGANNNLTPGGGFPTGIGRLDLDSTAGVANVTGLLAGTDGQQLIIRVLGGNTVTLNNSNAGSSAANQFLSGADVAVASGDSVLVMYYAGTVNKWVLVTIPASATTASADVQIFTTTGANTWTKPANAKFTCAVLIGAGGGGGSGGVNPAASIAAGGSGGGGGGFTNQSWPSSILGATETVTVGALGAGGTARAAGNGNGNVGNPGGNTTFGSWAFAGGGGAGGAGNAASAPLTTAGGAGGAGVASGATGGAVVTDGSGNLTNDVAPSSASNFAAGAGGGGGGTGTNNATASGAAGSAGSTAKSATGLAGGAAAGTGGGQVAGVGTAATASEPAGGGGGGGGAPSTNINAAAGGIYGGGGGGGAGTRTNPSGAGGNGANGIAIITTYF